MFNKNYKIMDTDPVIEKINKNIDSIVSHYIRLNHQNKEYVGLCPFHREKTPSFKVRPVHGYFKCFGCGASGDAISFIQKHENLDFKEAVEAGAKILNIDFNWGGNNDFNKEEYLHREALYKINNYVAEFFRSQLKANKKALDYMKKRNFEYINDDPFMVGYAPDANVLLDYAIKNNLKTELLLEAGNLKQSDDGRLYDTFRDRIIYPIYDKNGRIVGFSGRTLKHIEDRKPPKWLNTGDTKIFKKSEELFGLNVAKTSIKKEDKAYLVEGGFDVNRLNRIGIENTIAPNGTAFTKEQALLLKKYTNKVTLIFDGDSAGKKAIEKNAEMLIKEKFFVSVILLPDKEDPDSFFIDKKAFEEYIVNQEDYILHKVKNTFPKNSSPGIRSELIKQTVALIACYDEPSKQEVYLDAVSDIIKPKKAWQDELKVLVAEKCPNDGKTPIITIPKGVSLDEYQERGFYENNNCYFFADKKGKPVKQSNFKMLPLFHIESTINAKRLYEITNVYGITKVIEITQKDLISLAAFKLRVESLGNFLWTGAEQDLNRLKSWLYEKTESCKEIKQLGWQKEGFFAWGNGIFNGKFVKTDMYGIVNHNEQNYYIPANSKIYEKEENLFVFERNFIHIEGTITLKEYVKKFTQVFGNNGKIAFCFYLASLFRDVVVRRFDKFPMLNLFGPKGAGKNACAESLLYFFGQKQKVPNLHNTSKAALADHVATSANAMCALDEYRNDLELEKREFLKGLWDGIGRTRMNMDKDKKKEITCVDQGIIVCGQQMATADIALFSRFVVLSFTQTEYTQQEKDAFHELEEINKQGITQITHQILKHRNHFEKHYYKKYKKVAEKMMGRAGSTIVETRILNNWVTILAAYAVLESLLELPWKYHDTIDIAVELMLKQNQETKKNDDLSSFWKTVQYLISSNLLYDGGDFKHRFTDSFVWKKTKYKEENSPLQWDESKHLLIVNPQRIFNLYKNQAGKEGDKPLPRPTVEYYLKNSKAFLFETKKENFNKIDPKTGQQIVVNGNKQRINTSALIFDLKYLDLSLPGDDNYDGNEETEEDIKQDKTTITDNKINIDSEISADYDDDVKLPF